MNFETNEFIFFWYILNCFFDESVGKFKSNFTCRFCLIGICSINSFYKFVLPISYNYTNCALCKSEFSKVFQRIANNFYQLLGENKRNIWHYFSRFVCVKKKLRFSHFNQNCKFIAEKIKVVTSFDIFIHIYQIIILFGRD